MPPSAILPGIYIYTRTCEMDYSHVGQNTSTQILSALTLRFRSEIEVAAFIGGHRRIMHRERFDESHPHHERCADRQSRGHSASRPRIRLIRVAISMK